MDNQCFKGYFSQIINTDLIHYRSPVVTKVNVDTQYILFPQPYLAWVDISDTIHAGNIYCHLREYKEYQDATTTLR